MSNLAWSRYKNHTHEIWNAINSNNEMRKKIPPSNKYLPQNILCQQGHAINVQNQKY